MNQTIRVGLIGAGANTRSRHIPGFKAISGVEIVGVCNRRPESTSAAAQEFGIAKTFEKWQDLVADRAIDAIVVGTWPNLHCPIVLAAIEAGKHVLTEARMSMNVAEARAMYDASERNSKLVCQIVPSPFGLRGDRVVKDLIKDGYLGELRDATVFSMNDALGGADSPLSWRQDSALSGFNMLTLGILHETLLRWVPPPVRVSAQVHAFVHSRVDPSSGVQRSVGTPDSVQVLTTLANNARAVYQISGVTPFGGGMSIILRGSDGMLHYDFLADRITGLRRGDASKAPQEIPVSAEKASGWRVEADFVDSIREGKPVQYTNFETGVAYMEFTEAVAQSARDGETVTLDVETQDAQEI